MVNKTLALFALMFFLLVGVGCCPNQRMNVTVELDDAMKARLADLSNRHIQVDIIALNSSEHQRWQNYSMSKYWTPPFELEKSVKVFTMTFDSKSGAQTLTSKDPIWDTWFANASDKDIMRLYVLAQMPGTIDDSLGNTDPRRQILPLGKCRWEGDEVKLQVQLAGIRTLTNFKADKN